MSGPGLARGIGAALLAPVRRRDWALGYRASLGTDSMTGEEARAHHDRSLTRLVRDAARHVPFYRELYRRHGVDAAAFSGVADLAKLPTIGKADLLAHGERMVRPGLPSILRARMTTGGSTGTIATIVTRRGLGTVDLGCIHALWRRVGMRAGEPVVRLRGALVAGGRALSELDRESNCLVVSTYHLRDDNVGQIVDLIDSFAPQWLHVYPSAAALLAGAMKRTGRRFARRPKGVLCGSENVYPGQAELFEEVFGGRAYAHYGHSELALLGGWCEGARTYHFLPNYGYLELLDEAQGEVREPGASGEITGTGYLNRVMPLIRYRTGDWGAWDAPGPCPACGRAHQRLARIDGRQQEYLVLRDGGRFPLTNINALHGPFFSYIYRFQFVQGEPGRAVLRFVPAVPVDEARMAEIRSAFAYLEDVGLSLSFEPVDSIPLTPRGKQRVVVGPGDLPPAGAAPQTRPAP